MEQVVRDRRITFEPKAPPKNKGLTRGQKQTLVLLALVMLNVSGVLTLLIARGRLQIPSISAKPAVAVGGDMGLQVAHDQAQAQAVGWQRDAQLISAAARWQLAGRERLMLERASWSFNFYSPAASQVQILVVDQAGAHPVRQIPVGQAPVLVGAEWSIEGNELLRTFLAHGGEQFIRQHDPVSVHFRLSAQERGRPIWYLGAIAPEARQSFVVGVDALTRQVVPMD